MWMKFPVNLANQRRESQASFWAPIPPLQTPNLKAVAFPSGDLVNKNAECCSIQIPKEQLQCKSIPRVPWTCLDQGSGWLLEVGEHLTFSIYSVPSPGDMDPPERTKPPQWLVGTHRNSHWANPSGPQLGRLLCEVLGSA